MRKQLGLISPTLMMLVTLGYGAYLRLMVRAGWESWIAYSMAGLGLYAFILFFVGGIGKAMRGEKHFDKREKFFYGYLGSLWALVVVIGIYLMGHN
ncbi:LasU family protein [Lactiplantibacillus nangangensis]|uniref:LasU family protein n=1 Tax=Lactiplantibacillus nangangensis TaxID=2559917 RepID=A0ABW1SKA2_9LACO|nr:LasU family protein [Lactiplantibacillus nangangensis]